MGACTCVGECSDWRSWNEDNHVWNTKQAMDAATAALNIAPVITLLKSIYTKCIDYMFNFVESKYQRASTIEFVLNMSAIGRAL